MVEQVAIGVNTTTGAPFALPNVWVIETNPEGQITRLRDYINPAAVAEALGNVSGPLNNPAD